MGRQKEIPGTERPKIQEVEDAAEVYVKSRDKRIKASKAESTDKAALIAAMQKHKLNVYAIADEGLVVTVTNGKPEVKVTESKEADEPDDEPDEASSKKAEPVN